MKVWSIGKIIANNIHTILISLIKHKINSLMIINSFKKVWVISLHLLIQYKHLLQHARLLLTDRLETLIFHLKLFFSEHRDMNEDEQRKKIGRVSIVCKVINLISFTKYLLYINVTF